MKKLSVVAFLVIFATYAGATIPKSNGYDKATWGMSSKEVKEIYKNAIPCPKPSQENLCIFTPGDFTQLRVFVFYKGKLLQVLVKFNMTQMDSDILQGVVEKLREEYAHNDYDGEASWVEEEPTVEELGNYNFKVVKNETYTLEDSGVTNIQLVLITTATPINKVVTKEYEVNAYFLSLELIKEKAQDMVDAENKVKEQKKKKITI